SGARGASASRLGYASTSSRRAICPASLGLWMSRSEVTHYTCSLPQEHWLGINIDCKCVCVCVCVCFCVRHTQTQQYVCVCVCVCVCVRRTNTEVCLCMYLLFCSVDECVWASLVY